MCEDFLRAGHARMVVDPGVRQAYFPDTARQLYTDKVPEILPWITLISPSSQMSSGHAL